MAQMSDDSSLLKKFRSLESRADRFLQIIEEIEKLKERQESATSAMEQRRAEFDSLFLSIRAKEQSHDQEIKNLRETRINALQHHDELNRRLSIIEERIELLNHRFDSEINDFDSFIIRNKHIIEDKYKLFEEFIQERTQTVVNIIAELSNRVADELRDSIDQITKSSVDKISEVNATFTRLCSFEQTLVTNEEGRKKALENFNNDALSIVDQLKNNSQSIFNQIQADYSTLESRFNETSKRRINDVLVKINDGNTQKIDDFLRKQRVYIENMDSRYQSEIAIIKQHFEQLKVLEAKLKELESKRWFW